MTRIVVEHEAHRPYHHPFVIAQGEAGDDEGLGAEIHDVEHDRAAALDHRAHLTVGNHLLDRPADRRRRIVDAQAHRVAVVHPDQARLRIDDHRALAEIREVSEQGPVGQFAQIEIAVTTHRTDSRPTLRKLSLPALSSRSRAAILFIDIGMREAPRPIIKSIFPSPGHWRVEVGTLARATQPIPGY